MKMFNKTCFLLIPIFIILILNLGLISASDSDLTLNDTNNDISQDMVIYNDICDSSNLQMEEDNFKMEFGEEDYLEDYSSDSIWQDNVNKKVKNSLSTDDPEEDFLVYDEDIMNSTSDSYYAFFRYLVDDCGFEFRNTSNLGDGYLLYATANYSGVLFDGEEFTILPDDYYFVSTNDRMPYYVYHNYYEDIVYCHEDNYVLDEEYLGWLIWNANITNRDFSSGTLNELNITTIGEFFNYYSQTNEQGNRDTGLPSSYDLRDYGYVTPVKDQGSYGNCWAFATMAALESYLLKFENITYNLSAEWDFSENNLKNVMSSRGRNGTDYEVDNGGNMFMALAYLLRWSGPVNETDDPYGNNYTLGEEYFSPTKHIQGIKFIPKRTNALDNDAIKEAIYNYGGVVILMYWDNSFLNNGKDYYLINSSNVNLSGNGWHSVTVVGWDDDYSKNNFRNVSENMGDGAFIIKNSWGESNGENGYYYISYFDDVFCFYENLGLAGFAFTSVENSTNFANNYNYNPLGLTEYLSFNQNWGIFANQWVAEKNETLKACGLYVLEPYACQIKVLVNGVYVGGSTTSQIDFPGFHTIYLNQSVTINQGDTYWIQVTLMNANANHVYLPLEMKKENYSKVSAGANQSFIYITNNGVNEFVDLTTQFADANICLHAFTEFVNGLVDTVVVANDLNTVFNDSDLNATVMDIYGNPLVGKRVVFEFNGVTYNKTTDSDGKVRLHIGLYPGVYTFSIIFIGDDDHYQSVRIVTVNVTRKATNVICGMTQCYFNEKLNVTLKDSSGRPLANKKVVFYLYNTHYDKTTDSNGKASLEINLNNGTHTFIIKFNGDRSYLSSSKTVNLKVKRAPAKVNVPNYQVPYNSNITLNVTVKNNVTNNPISKTMIRFKVYTGNNYNTYEKKTNSAGIARINLSRFSVGTHKVVISSANSNVVFASITKNIKVLSA